MPDQSDERAAAGRPGNGAPGETPPDAARDGVGDDATVGAPATNPGDQHRTGDGGRGPSAAGGDDERQSADAAGIAAAGWQLFRRLAMSCPLPVFATDAAGRHVFVNPRWSELTGIEPDEAMGWGWERAVHPHDLLAVTSQWGLAEAGGDGLWIRLRLLRPDGLHRAAVLQAVPTGGDAGVPRFVGTLTPLPPLPPPGRGDGGEPVALPPPLEAPYNPPPANFGTQRTDPVGSNLFERPESTAAGPDGRRDGRTRADGDGGGRPAAVRRAAADGNGHGPAQVSVPLPRTGQEPPWATAKDHGTLGSAGPDDQPPGWEDDPADWAGADDGDDLDEPGADWWNEALNLASRDGAESSGLFGTPGDRGPSRPRHDHHAWDGNRRRAAAPDGGDIWPVGAETRAVPSLGGEWRAAIALHGRAPDGWAAGAHSTDGHHDVRAHASAQGRDGRPANDGGQGVTARHGGGPGAGRGSGAGDGGRGRVDRLPPAECGCLYGELTRAESACRDRERWLTSLLAELPTAVLLADAHSQVVGVNQAYCDLFDLADAPVELVGTDCRLLLRPRAGLVDDPAGFADRLDTLLRRRRTLRRETVMFADGRVFERSHLPLVSPDGYRGHLWLYVDVTDRRILDAEIEGLISEL